MGKAGEDACVSMCRSVGCVWMNMSVSVNGSIWESKCVKVSMHECVCWHQLSVISAIDFSQKSIGREMLYK